MVGLFINTLPVRVRVESEAEVIEWLRRLQGEQVEMREYEYSPLVEVQRWSEVGAGTPLFESLLAFENYPVDRSLVKRASEQTATLKVSDVDTSEQSNLPLALIVVPGEELNIRASYESSRLDSVLVERMLRHLERLLSSIAANPDAKLSALAMLSDEENILLERTTAIDELEQSLSF